LTFGVQRKLLPEFLTYGALHYLHGKKIITSPDLMVIEPDATYKSVLWNQLKLMFGIK
jgi:DNA polymerase III psi subunit